MRKIKIDFNTTVLYIYIFKKESKKLSFHISVVRIHECRETRKLADTISKYAFVHGNIQLLMTSITFSRAYAICVYATPADMDSPVHPAVYFKPRCKAIRVRKVDCSPLKKDLGMVNAEHASWSVILVGSNRPVTIANYISSSSWLSYSQVNNKDK